MAKMKIIFTTPILRHPPDGGPYLRIENSIKALNQVSNLYIYSRVSKRHMGGEEALLFYKRHCNRFYFAPSVSGLCIKSAFKRAVNKASRLIFRKDIFDMSLLQKNDAEFLLKIADKIGADAIWLGYGNISYPLLKYLKGHSKYKIVCDTDSVHSKFILRGLPYACDVRHYKKIEIAGKKKEEEERAGTFLADITTAVSEIDAGYYRGFAKSQGQIHIFSNAVDIDVYRRVSPPAGGLKKPCICFIGSFGPESPMEDGARWMINEILPLVRAKIKDIHLYIIGFGSKTTLAGINDRNITITGRLPSVLPYLCYANLAVAPLRFESGTRFKILEAGACGLPVVSTTLGAEGLAVTNGKDILIADSPDDFAGAIIKLIQDESLSLQLGKNLRALVQCRYSVENLKMEAKTVLEQLGK